MLDLISTMVRQPSGQSAMTSARRPLARVNSGIVTCPSCANRRRTPRWMPAATGDWRRSAAGRGTLAERSSRAIRESDLRRQVRPLRGAPQGRQMSRQPRPSAITMAAPFSAIIIVGELVLPEVMRGIAEASMTRKPFDAAHPQALVEHGRGIVRRCPSSPSRRDGRSSCRCRPPLRAARRPSSRSAPGPVLLRPEARERRLRDDAARQPQRIDRDPPVLLRREIVRADRRRLCADRRSTAWTLPRLDGLRLQTLAVKAPKGCRPSPHLSSESGWKWNSRLAVA